MRVPALPPRGGDTLATSCEVTAGGGFNVMSAAARLGLPAVYAGGHGTGPWGDLVRAALAAEGIGLLRPPDQDRDTGFDVALVEPDAERTFVTHLGAEAVRGPGALGRGAGRAGRRGLRVRLRPGPAGLRPGPRRLGGRAADWCPAVRGPRPAGGADPGRGARSRAVPLRLAELQPPGGRLAHQHWARRLRFNRRGTAAAVRRTRPATRRNWPAACSPAAPPRTSSSGTGPRAATSPCSGRPTPSTCGRRR